MENKREPSFEELLEKLKDDDLWIRESTVNALACIDDKRVIEILLAVLNDPAQRVRLAAVGALFDLQEEELLIQILKDKYEDDVKNEAMGALTEMGHENAIEPLIQALKDESLEVRTSAAHSLGIMKNQKAVEPLFEVLKYDKEDYARQAAAEAIGKIGNKKTTEQLIQILKEEGEDAIGYVPVALKYLGGRWDPAYSNPNEDVVQPLLQALKENGEKFRELLSIKPFLQAIEEDKFRKRIIRVMKYLGNEKEEAIKLFIQALKEEDEIINSAVNYILYNLKETSFKPLLLALKDENKSIRDEVVEIILDRGRVRELEVLSKELGEGDEEMKIISGLGLFKSNWYKSGFDYKKLIEPIVGEKKLLEPLLLALNDENYDVVFSAVEEIKELNDIRAIEPLLELLKSEREGMKQIAAIPLATLGDERVVEPLIQAFDDEDEEARMWVIEALGRFGDKRATPTLIQALKDEDIEVRLSAIDWLGKIGDVRAIEPLKQAMKEEKDEYIKSKIESTLEKLEKE